MLGALSKIVATIVTHPLIVAKTMLQSKSVGSRGAKPFKGFTEVLIFILRNEGFLRLYKGLLPQITKGFLVQGLMMLFKERYVFNLLGVYRSIFWGVSHIITEWKRFSCWP